MASTADWKRSADPASTVQVMVPLPVTEATDSPDCPAVKVPKTPL
jgi:hypothetical protein